MFALGGQLTTGKAQWRLGYSYARDPLKRNLDPGVIGIGNNYQIGSPVGPIPVTGGVVEYFQATNAGAIWEHSVTAGIGYQLLPMLRVDAHAALALKEDDKVGVTEHTKVEASAWQAGLGFTWAFK